MKKLLFLGFIFYFISGLFAVDTYTPSLSALRHFDAGTGATAKDEITKKNGTITNAVWADGKIGKCLLFNANDASSDLVTFTGYAMPTTFTFSTWVNRTSTTTTAGFDRILSAGGTAATELASTNPTVTIKNIWLFQAFTDATSTGWTDTGYTLPNNEWHWLTLSWDGTYFRLYNQGLKVWTSASYAGKTIKTGSNLIGGNTTASKAGAFCGYIDEPTVWTGALTDSQVLYFYHSYFNNKGYSK
jgi:hypothetical protein